MTLKSFKIDFIILIGLSLIVLFLWLYQSIQDRRRMKFLRWLSGVLLTLLIVIILLLWMYDFHFPYSEFPTSSLHCLHDPLDVEQARISPVYTIIWPVLIYAAGVATPILLWYLIRYVKGRREPAEGVR